MKKFPGLEGSEGRCQYGRCYEGRKRSARLREFRTGWRHGADNKMFGESATLEKLTWHNVGWRLGWMLGGAGDTDERLEAIFDRLVDQYQHSGRVVWHDS